VGQSRVRLWGWAGGSLRRRVLRPHPGLARDPRLEVAGRGRYGRPIGQPHRPTRSDGSRPPAPSGKSSVLPAASRGATECPRDQRMSRSHGVPSSTSANSRHICATTGTRDRRTHPQPSTIASIQRPTRGWISTWALAIACQYSRWHVSVWLLRPVRRRNINGRAT